MSKWVKIQSFSRIHQAELRKDILEQNDINAVIVNEKDSLFLLGELELFVEEHNEKKAKALIDEFSGLTKINSFIDMKPILLFQKILKDNGIQTILKRQSNRKYSDDNFELYVENDKIDEIVPFLTGEKLVGRKKIIICNKVRQAKYYVDLISAVSIDSLIIKKKDSDFHLEEIHIYVEDKDVIKAQQVINELKEYKAIKFSVNPAEIEKDEEVLFKHSIKALVKKADKGYHLFVESDNYSKAEDVLGAQREWVTLAGFKDLVNALYIKGLMDFEGIPNIIFNDQDSSFLIGEIELLVDKSYFEKAQDILKNAR